MTELTWKVRRGISDRYGTPDWKMTNLLSLFVIATFLTTLQHVEGYHENRNEICGEWRNEDDDSRLLEFLNSMQDEDGTDENDSDGTYPKDDMTAYFIEFTESKISYSDLILNRIKVTKFLKEYQEELHKWRKKGAIALWNKETNLTQHNLDISKKVSLEFSAWDMKKRLEATKFSKKGLSYVQRRMLKSILESTSLNEPGLRKELVTLESRISAVYSKAVVCNNSAGKCYHFEPGLIKLFRKSRDYDELLWAWKGWRDAIGPKIRQDWLHAVNLKNQGAREHDFPDFGYYIRYLYEAPTFESDIDKLWRKLEPLYQQLHAYVRYKLHQKYGDRVSLTKPIPAHLLGGMWAMKWDALLDMVEPYPKTGGFEVTKGMLEKNITVHRMFTLADEFYQSIGLPAMTPQFWNRSMFTRPKDNRSVVCYASAHNMEGDDVRVKMCAVVNAEYLYVVHHEMGHCQYYLGYNRHQPEIFQSGANHGFHEAIGDTAALSVISPTHLDKLGILKQGAITKEKRRQKDLNFLMQKALGKLAFFPFALTMSKWTWDVARGVIPTTEVNAAWWRYRKRYQGIMPPIDRTEHDFDAGSKYHIANFVPYVRYFVSHVLQFQFYEALCKQANYKGPLHRCDFASSKKTGEKFKKMLDMGSSKPWQCAMRELTGTTKMSADSVIRYFAPLLTWLNAENRRLGLKIGWD